MAIENWALQVYGRKDGWVELDLAVIPKLPRALPWIYSEDFRGKIGAPVQSRAYFTPAQIHAATSFADSLLDATIPDSVARKRFSNGLPHFIDMPARSEKGGGSLVSIYMGVERRPGAPPSATDIVSFGVGGCLEVLDVSPSLAGAALLGRGVERSAQEFRAMLRKLDTAAALALQSAPTPKELHAALIDADDAACEARPDYHMFRPDYPGDGGGKTADVYVDAVVDTAGRVDASSIKVTTSAGAVFDSAAVSAARQFRFAPALLTAGVSVAQRVHVDVHFAPKPPSGNDMGHLVDDATKAGAGIVVVSKARKG